MADRVNLKVSEVTHEAIKEEKREGETIDDVLRRKFDLNTTEDVKNDLAAYLPDYLREQAQDIADFISTLNDFERGVEEATIGDHLLKFISPESGVTIVQMEFSEDDYRVAYRDPNGDFSEVVGWGVDKKEYWTTDGEPDIEIDSKPQDLDEVKEEIEHRVRGALRKWG